MPTADAVHHPIFARVYGRLSRAGEDRGAADHRRRMLDGATGTVVEVGAGNGLNFAHYPPTVASVIAVEPEPHLRRLAHAAAREAPVPVEVQAGTAERLPLGDASCDVAVASLMLCSVSDPAEALAELRRVLRPGGELRFYEHVLSAQPWLARVQRIAQRTVWPMLCGGCHPARDTGAAIAQAGFVIERHETFLFSMSPLQPAVPFIVGISRRT